MNPIIIIIHNPNVWNAKDNDGNHKELSRRAASGKGGEHQRGNGNSIVFCVSDWDGMEDLITEPNTIVTSYEEIFGYQKQVTISVQNKIDIDGNGILDQFAPGFHDELQFDENGDPVMETIPPVAAMRAQYDAVWPNNDPAKDEPLMGIPAGYDISHLTI